WTEHARARARDCRSPAATPWPPEPGPQPRPSAPGRHTACAGYPGRRGPAAGAPGPRRAGPALQQPLDLVGGGVEGVAGIGQLAQPPVLVTVPLGVRDHPLDLGLVQVRGLADGDPLFGAG